MDKKEFILLNDGGSFVFDEIAALTRTENMLGTYNWFVILKSGKEIQISSTDYINLQKHIRYVKD